MTDDFEAKLNTLVARVKKVRVWLVIISILKVTAYSLFFVSIYIGAYSWIDHRVHFGSIGRIIALIVMAGGILYLLSYLGRYLVGHLSCSRAANHIESKSSFDQQLVTAIEYYEQKQDYPYSKDMVQRLVLQLDRDSDDFQFDSTVPKWFAYILVSIIIIGFGISTFYLHDNYVFFSQYATRLARPLAKVDPLPPTSLAAITKDIIVEPGQTFNLKAHIQGRVPDYGTLVFAGMDVVENDTNKNREVPENLSIQPDLDDQDEPIFESVMSFEQPGRFKYRFEAGDAFSPWHNITICDIPRIKSISANVSLGSNQYIMPYKEQVKDSSLNVLNGSFVVLRIEVTEKLSQATITDLDNIRRVKEIENTNCFDYSFIAKKEGFIDFTLVGESGIANKDIPALQIMIKVDEPAKINLLSPGSDYLATNVASVPVTFEVSDDFGLVSVAMVSEIAGAEPVKLKVPVERGEKKHIFTHTFELEDYDLSVGDSIMFYAEALDVNTGSNSINDTACSDIFFIEIRPYIQLWHEDMMLSPDRQGKVKKRGTSQEKLIQVLEYTRAIVKKTWTISQMAELSEQTKSRLESIDSDVHFCAGEVTVIRDDDSIDFTAGDIGVLNEVLSHYDRASQYLRANQASSAVPPEKKAYRTLRKFIIENDLKLCPPGFGSTPETPDKIKMQENVHLKRFQEERIKWEMKQLVQQLDQQADQQKRIQKMFDHFLSQQDKKKYAQKTTDEESWNEEPGPSMPDKPCKPQNGNPGAPEQKPSIEGALQSPPEPKCMPKGMGNKKGVAAGNGERIKMLQAMQKDLQDRVVELKKALASLPATSQENEKKRKQSYGHIDKAVSGMGNAMGEMGKSQYEAKADKKTLSEASKDLEKASKELQFAKDNLVSELDLTELEELAMEAQNLAEQLIELAEEFESKESQGELEEMLEKLEQIEDMFTIFSEQIFQKTSQQQQDGSQGMSGGKDRIVSGSRRYKKPDGAPAHRARFLAEQFFVLAINAKKHQGPLLEDDASDKRFHEFENKFFEDAAKFDPKKVTQ